MLSLTSTRLLIPVDPTYLTQPGTIFTAQRLNGKSQDNLITHQRLQINLDPVMRIQIKFICQGQPTLLMGGCSRCGWKEGSPYFYRNVVTHHV